MTDDESSTCRSCGGNIKFAKRTGPRPLGAKSGGTGFVRVCTNDECSTNNPKRRRLGEAP